MSDEQGIIFGDPMRGKTYSGWLRVMSRDETFWRGWRKFFIISRSRTGASSDGGMEWGDWHLVSARFVFTDRLVRFLDRLATRIVRRLDK